MPNNPVQIILNEKDFLQQPDAGMMGPPKDFYLNQDDLFKKHKQQITTQIEAVAEAMELSSFGPATYASIKLKDDALAKSYRPNRALFRPEIFPCVGVGSIGEVYYLISNENIGSLLDSVKKAETTTKWGIHAKSGEKVIRTSPERSEVGAIDQIRLVTSSEKIKFSVEEAVAWLEDASSSGYIVELFELPEKDKTSLGRGALYKSLEQLITSFGIGIHGSLLRSFANSYLINLRVSQSALPAKMEDRRLGGERQKNLAPLNKSIELHQRILQRLASHPLVRRISLPPKIILSAPATAPASAGTVVFSEKVADSSYPKVGVIDTGVSDHLNQWILGRYDYLQDKHLDKVHGTFVGGLLVEARNINGPQIGREDNGCEIFDIPLFPDEKVGFGVVYPNGFQDFLEEVEQAVQEASENHGIKVFNLSINTKSPVETDDYSYYAARLDEISKKYNIIFVNSVGNLPMAGSRAPWQKKTASILEYFATRTEPDTIHKPSESVYAISVGALNPPNAHGHIEGAPTIYTRRGPGLRVGNKPDLAHFGGCGVISDHGLKSIDLLGRVVSNCGTSYAAPLVSKSLAALDARIPGHLPAHVLRALMIHHTEIPASLSSNRLKSLVRQFIGFGMPLRSEEMLLTGDNTITMVFNSVLPLGNIPSGKIKPQVMRFPFSWPKSLVDLNTMRCFGHVKMSLVYLPPLDRNFGAEFVRVNLDAKLQQRQPNDTTKGMPSFVDEINQCYLPKTAGQPAFEKELINQGLKWWPTKKYERKITSEGVGSSSEWRIEVSATTRAEANFPDEGIPFALVLTISDPNGAAIFQELRRDLISKHVVMEDIRVASRIRPRS